MAASPDKPEKAVDVVAAIREAETAEQVRALSEGDERKTVVKAAAERLSALDAETEGPDAADDPAAQAEAKPRPEAAQEAEEEPEAEEPEADEPGQEPEAEEEQEADEEPEPEAEEPEAEAATEAPKPARRAAPRRAERQRPARRERRDAEPELPVVRARARFIRTPPRKARVVADQIRGRHVDDAKALLTFSSRAAARDFSKLLDSAVANAENNHDLLADELRIAEVSVDDGPMLKRYRPRALGRATPIEKRTSHLAIALVPTDED